MPQILMLTSAMQKNKRRLDRQLGNERSGQQSSYEDSVETPSDLPSFKGKSVDQLSSDDFMSYLNS
jgi:hypothetical protein